MLDAGITNGSLVARPAAALPIAQMVVGKPVAEVADLLPRVFALCRAAQSMAATTALGLPTAPGADTALSVEVLRDHLMKLCLHWPAKLGQAPRSLPEGWREKRGVARAIFGAGAPPATPEAFEAFLGSDLGVAALLRAIGSCFEGGIAATPGLADPDHVTCLAPGPVENSVAGRQAAHPVLRHLEATRGRGPLWRAAARLYDLADALNGTLPPPEAPGPGQALVCAARGTYAVTAGTRDGRVAHFARLTPTDHLLAPGGILEASLRALPADREGLAPLLLDILDPCSPVRLARREVSDA